MYIDFQFGRSATFSDTIQLWVYGEVKQVEDTWIIMLVHSLYTELAVNLFLDEYC